MQNKGQKYFRLFAVAGVLFSLLHFGSLAHAKELVVHQNNSVLLAQNTTTTEVGTARTFGLDESASESGIQFTKGNPYTLAGLIINIVLSFLGIVFMVIVIWAGILWMTASGNSDQIKKAQGMIKNAVLGLIIVAMAYIITQNIFDIITQELPNQTTNTTSSTTGAPTGDNQ